MKKILFLFSLLFCYTSGFSQQKLKKADKLFADLAYVDAAKAYEEYLEKEQQPGTETIMNIADAYYYTGNMPGALRWYSKLDEVLGSSMDDTYFNRYIQAMRAEERYKRADDLLKQRLDRKGDRKAIERYINQKGHLDSISTKESNYTVNNLAINTNKADFGTAFYGNRIVYSSSKDTMRRSKIYSWNDQPFLELYIADRNASDGSFFNEQKFIPSAQTRYHNATLTFSSDLKTVYYSSNNVKKNDKLNNSSSGINNIEIIKGNIEGNKLVNADGLPFNSTDYSIGHPALTKDGKWLFFVSDMPGGYGDTDVYVVEVFSDGKLGSPRNLGPTINTSGREMFPFINDSVLYFSSDGHYGLGGLDVFESTRVDDYEFTEPKNLGKPVNSNLDDFAFIISEDEKYGYFSSSRKEGKGDDDIYYFTKKAVPCMQLVSGKVTNTKYKVGINMADIKVYNLFGDVIKTTQTDKEGNYKIEVPCNTKVKIEASKPNHTKAERELEISAANGNEIKNVNFELSDYGDLVVVEDDVEKVAIDPIFFEFNKWNITTQAAKELDKVVYMLKNFPNIIIKIESHTDSRGRDQYNLELSKKRANSTYQYLLSKGIEASRVESVKGYGETRLRNRCSNGVECSDEEHLLNRRSDFIIVKK